MKTLISFILIILLCISNVYAEQKTFSYNIQINAASQTLRLFSNEVLMKEYPVAVGKSTSKTPLGSFTIRNKVVNPWWKGVAPGPKNPLGIRWMGITVPRGSYGIHGNNTPSSIGTYASGGCVRMFNNDVEELFAKMTVATPVEITYENVELKKDPYREAYVLIIYPDVYKQKKTETLIKKFAETDKNITLEQREKALKLAVGNIPSPIAVCDGTAVMLNNRFVTSDAFYEEKQLYIYSMAAIEYLGIDADFVNEHSIAVVERDNKTYINLTQAASFIGAELKTDAEHNNTYLKCSFVKINGKFAGSYKGGFDKEYMLDSSIINKIGNYIDAGSKKTVNAKEFCKQQNWLLTPDSFNKVIHITIPLRLKVSDTFIDTVPYNGRYYINSSDASQIIDIQNQNLNVYNYQNIDYYDVYEIMDLYEVQQDRFFTVLEVLRPLNSEV